MPVLARSEFAYADTIAKLGEAIARAGNTIFATIDQTRAAAGSGLTLRPTTLIVFGNPAGGTPLMDAFPIAALDLPLKLLVWDDDGTITVAYTAAHEIAARYGIPATSAAIVAMDRMLATLSAAVARPGSTPGSGS